VPIDEINHRHLSSDEEEFENNEDLERIANELWLPDVVMLQYPLDHHMSNTYQHNDLQFYQKVYDFRKREGDSPETR
jgi:hypothetical protein